MTSVRLSHCPPPPLPNVSRNRGLGFIFNDVEEMYNVPGHVVTEDMNKYIHTLQIIDERVQPRLQ